MTSSDQTALPDDAKARAAARVGSSLDPGGLAPGRGAGDPGGLRLRRVQRRDHRPAAGGRPRRAGRPPGATWAGPWSPGRAGRSNSRWWPAAWPRRGGWTRSWPWGRSSGATPATTTSWPGSAPRGLQRVQLDTGLPVVFGVLTTDTVEQALVRSLPDATNKGGRGGPDRGRRRWPCCGVLERLASGGRVGFTVGGR